MLAFAFLSDTVSMPVKTDSYRVYICRSFPQWEELSLVQRMSLALSEAFGAPNDWGTDVWYRKGGGGLSFPLPLPQGNRSVGSAHIPRSYYTQYIIDVQF